MDKLKGSTPVRNPEALAEFTRAEQLQQQAEQLEAEIERLLSPVRDQLSALVVERDRLSYEALASRQRFFQAARKSDPSLEAHSSLHFEKRGEEVHVVWDDSGPRYSDAEGAELPRLHAFERREQGRRGIDFIHKLR